MWSRLAARTTAHTGIAAPLGRTTLGVRAAVTTPEARVGEGGVTDKRKRSWEGGHGRRGQSNEELRRVGSGNPTYLKRKLAG